MRTRTGPVPAERTKMSAPAGLWTIWDLKAAGRAGCAEATCAEMTASEVASRMPPEIFEQSPIVSGSPWPLVESVSLYGLRGRKIGPKWQEAISDGDSDEKIYLLTQRDG